MTTTNLNGHQIEFINNNWIYTDTKIPISKEERLCIRCGKPQTEDEHDFCIQNLGQVVSACCGHGVEKGYIMFDNGITIRGYFEVEKSHDFTKKST